MLNDAIIKQFELLIKQIKHDINNANTKNDKQTHYHRLQSIMTAIQIIKSYPNKITSGEQIASIKGIGTGTIRRINEIIQTGKLAEITIDRTSDYIDNLTKIIGIGNKTAHTLVTKYNVTNVSDLKKLVKNNKIKLNEQIMTGLQYYDIYKTHIPRSEIDDIKLYLKKLAKTISNKLKVKICGSYRRQTSHSNDIDVLITHTNVKTKADLENNKNYLHEYVNLLKKNNFLLHDLTNRNYKVKYMGFSKYLSKPVRRIDIRYVPYNSYYTAVMYFTGSKNFNKKIRNVAIGLGMELSEYGLYLYKNGIKYKYKIKSEKDIFDKLGLEYVDPHKR